MAARIDSWSAVRTGIAGAALIAGLALGPAIAAQADPSATPTPAPSTSALPATATATAAAPTVAGGAAAPAGSAATAAGTAAAGATAAGTATATGAASTTAGGDVLDQLAQQYAVGSGGGQLSNLLKTSLKLRAMGFKPSKQYLDEITEAMAHRPNQLPLIGALKDTIAYQQKIQAQMQVLQNAQGKAGMGTGAGSAPGPSNPANVAPGLPQQAAAVPAPQPAAGAGAPAGPLIVAPQ